jgi:hypothetical protein
MYLAATAPQVIFLERDALSATAPHVILASCSLARLRLRPQRNARRVRLRLARASQRGGIHIESVGLDGESSVANHLRARRPSFRHLLEHLGPYVGSLQPHSVCR